LDGSSHPAKKRILLIGGNGNPSGVPRHIEMLSEVLSCQADLTVASGRGSGGFDRLAALAVHREIIPGLSTSLSLAANFRSLRALQNLLSSTHFDVIWAHARMAVILLRLLIIWGLWTPKTTQVLAITYHGLPFGTGRLPGISWVSCKLERWLLRRTHGFTLIFLDPQMAETMRHKMGDSLQNHRIEVLKNSSALGVITGETGITHVPCNQRNLIMTARSGWQKNYNKAVRLFRHMPQNYHLYLCGEGTKSIWFNLKLWWLTDPETRKRITCYGPVADVRPLLAQSDCYLLTSRYEGVPIGALEAFEVGLPVVLSAFDGAHLLSQTHPHAEILDMKDLRKNALQIDQLLDQFLGDRKEISRSIIKGWQRHWSRTEFDQNVIRLLQTMTGTQIAANTVTQVD
jgi:glycosyltransferase involved in cell wall biosynthesis